MHLVHAFIYVFYVSTLPGYINIPNMSHCPPQQVNVIVNSGKNGSYQEDRKTITKESPWILLEGI